MDGKPTKRTWGETFTISFPFPTKTCHKLHLEPLVTCLSAEACCLLESIDVGLGHVISNSTPCTIHSQFVNNPFKTKKAQIQIRKQVQQKQSLFS